MQFRFCITLSLFLLQMLAGTSSAVTQDEIKALVEARYRITEPSFFGDFKEIGTVLVLQKEGLRANRPSKIFTPNVINGHQVVTVGGGNLPLGGKVEPDLKIGDRLHLYGVRSGDNFV